MTKKLGGKHPTGRVCLGWNKKKLSCGTAGEQKNGKMAGGGEGKSTVGEGGPKGCSRQGR